MNPYPTDATGQRKGERGAALIFTLLISLLLLTAGGVLILTTSITGTNTINATAEMQAYYAAEAGLQQALNVIRSHDLPAGTLPPGSDKLSFRDVLASPTLATWLTYDGPVINGAQTKVIGSNAYSITVSDPDNTPQPDKPTRLLVSVTGYGPRMAQKKLEALILQAGLYGFSTPATVTLVGAEDPLAAPPILFDTGDSSQVRYSGIDGAGAGNRPAFGTTPAAVNAVRAGIQRPNQIVGDDVGPLGDGTNGTLPTPEWLESADATREFVDLLRQTASPERYFTTATQPPASNVAGLTFIEGNADLGSGNQGSGLLIVTGNLTMQGNTSFNGLILVLGGGSVVRNGSGNGVITGGLVIARFGSTGGFLESTFRTNGGGNSRIQYNSSVVGNAVNAVPSVTVLGVVEK